MKTLKPLSFRRSATSLALPLAAALPLASLCSGCAPPDADEPIGRSASALTGTISFDSSCTTAPSPQTTPPAVPANVMRHLRIAEAYTRIAASSPAFRECLTSVMTRPTTLGPPGSTWMSGPYHACSGDPAPATVDGVMSRVLSSNGTLIRCDYATIGTSTGGYANIGAIDAMGREVINFGNELGGMSVPENCSFNPDGSPCLSDAGYTAAASTIGHEIMHAQGYDHVGDVVWNLNNVNIGDVVGTGPSAWTLTAGDFCGITPAPTPGNNGIAPTSPTSTPTPGRHPTYGSGIPYQVDQCITTVLAWSSASGHLHDNCGPSFPGLNLVDSVMSGSPSTATSHCVRDPYTGLGGAPIPPHAPTACRVTPNCRTNVPPSITCASHDANPLHLERRPAGTGSPWRRAAYYDAGFDYRVCAESLYGRACSIPTVTMPICLPGLEVERPDPIPWWLWQPFTGMPVAGDLADRLGGVLMALPVPALDAGAYAFLGKASGDLSSSFGALGIGVYNPQIGRFSALGPSSGVLPPVRGTAFAMVMGAGGLPHLLGFGGETAKGEPLPTLYDGAVTIDAAATSAKWASAPIPGTGPGARARAAAVGNVQGDTAFLFGGRTPGGVAGDLWSYSVADGKWALQASGLASPRVDAAMTMDKGRLVIFGGLDDKGNALGDLVVMDLKKGTVERYATSVIPRAGAAIAIQGGAVYLYGGQGATGASEALDVVSLLDGKTVSSTSLGVAAAAGSSIGIDAEAAIAVVPGGVPGAKLRSGAFVGPLDRLAFVGK